MELLLTIFVVDLSLSSVALWDCTVVSGCVARQRGQHASLWRGRCWRRSLVLYNRMQDGIQVFLLIMLDSVQHAHFSTAPPPFTLHGFMDR